MAFNCLLVRIFNPALPRRLDVTIFSQSFYWKTSGIATLRPFTCPPCLRVLAPPCPQSRRLALIRWRTPWSAAVTTARGRSGSASQQATRTALPQCS
eukprot:2273472-Pleurochrysis_carterae.AAC.1